MMPTSSHLTVAVFSVLQPVLNVTVDEMNSGPALEAFIDAVIATLDASEVTSVDISSVVAKNSIMSRMYLQGSSDSVVVGYDVTFQTNGDSVDNVYSSLVSRLTFYVEIGIFHRIFNSSVTPESRPNCLANLLGDRNSYGFRLYRTS
jgi:hypothetical protein